MKLKTVDDIECLNNTHDHETRGDFCIIRKSDLKTKAVKWFKYWRNSITQPDKEDIFLEFHNITEEDLK